MNQARNLAFGLVCLAAMAVPSAFAAGTLPSEYTEIEYIQGNGSSARIVTDYTPNPNTDKIEAVVEWPANTLGSNQAIWCARGNGTQVDSWTLFNLRGNTDDFRFDYMPSANPISLTPNFHNVTGTKYTITAEDNTITYVANGSVLQTQSTPTVSFTAGSVLALFASHYSGINANVGNYGKQKLYSFKVWRSGTLLHYFVPCKDSGGAATLVDICDNPATLTKSGTFTAGPEGHYFDDTLFTIDDDTLVVSGSPGNIGSPSPAYGRRTGLAAGDTLSVSCGATILTNGTTECIYQGWKLYAEDGSVVSNGTESAFTYTHPTPAKGRRLVWQWKTRPVGADATDLVPTLCMTFNGQSLANTGTGTLTMKDKGTPTYVSSANGYALDASLYTPWGDNVSGVITANRDSSIAVSAALGTTSCGILVCFRNSSNNAGIILRRGTAANQVVLTQGNSSAALITVNNVENADTDYHLYVMNILSSGVELYVDGEFAGRTASTPRANSMNSMQIGSRHGNVISPEAVYGGGLIDDLRVYASALNTDQMIALADSLLPALAIRPIPTQHVLPGIRPEPGFTIANRRTGASWVFAEGGVASGETPFDVAYGFTNGYGTVTATGKVGGEYEGETLTRTYLVTDEFLLNGGFESGTMLPGWIGSNSARSYVIDASNGHKPNQTTTFISGTYCGMLKQTCSMQQVFTCESPSRATLSWKCKHRCDWGAGTVYYSVLLDGEVIYPEETVTGSDVRHRSVEDLVLAPGEHTLKFDGRTDNDADTSLFLDDISLRMLSTLELLPIPGQTYDVGHVYRPEFTVSNVVSAQTWRLGGDIASADFDVAYTNNDRIGVATVTATGKGALAGEVLTASFNIFGRYYARPEVAVEGDGTSWATAMSVTNLFATLGTTTAPAEVWIAAGTVSAQAFSITNNADLVIRGGFAGTEATLDERQPGALTIFDGENTAKCPLKVLTGEDAELVIDRLKFYRAKENGFIKTGAGSLKVLDCVIEGNGKNVEKVFGRGMNVSGGGAGSLVVSNCVFKGNRVTSGIYTYGGFGLYVNKFKTALVDDSLFVTNGYAIAAPGAGGNVGADGGFGGAMRVIDTPVTVRRCRFAGNVSPLWKNTDSGGVLALTGACGGSVIDHCVFIGNTDRGTGQVAGDINTGGALAVKLSSATAKVKVQHCTFAYNIAHGHYSAGGISVAVGDVDIENSIFWKNTRARATTIGYGSDVQVSSGSKASIRSSMVTTLDGTALVGAGLTIDKASVLAGDAKLVTTTESFTNLLTVTSSSIYYNPSKSGIYESLAAMDAHLLSPAGYVVNGGAAGPSTTDYSQAIDFGDPAADYSNEPAPNGGRLNAGAFGNTAEASRTAYGQPKATVEVLYPDGTPQPLVKITMGLESGDAYSATVRIVCSTNGVTLADEIFSFIGNGQVVEYLLPAYLPLGTAFTAAVTVTAPEAETRYYDATEAATGAYPPWYGKKGPDNVIHVRQDASGGNDGTSWTDAFTSWADALNAVSAEKNEIWVAGTNLMYEATTTKAFTYPVVVRGGFRGWEESAAERPAGLRSVVDGRNLFDTFDFSNTDDVLVESIEFLRGGYRGLKKTASAGNITISNCVFYGCTKGKGNWDGNGNANVSYQYGGGGAGLYGSGSAKATVVDCLFEANIINSAGGNGGFGGGLYVGSFGGGAEIYRCSFVTNYMQRNFDSSRASMAALHVYNTRATIDCCSFYGHYAEGSVDVNGSCSGSIFRRCSFVGNYGGSAGILKVSLSNTNNTTRVENCTFAYNIAPALNCTKGAVAVTNCIFYGNLANVNATAAADIRVAADATATVDYCLFAVPESDGSTICVSETTPDSLQIGPNCIYGNPLFVTPTNTVMAHVNSPAGATMPRVLPSNFSWSWSKPVPTFEQAMGYDVHLRSYIGTWDNSGQLRKFLKELSPAIDAGDKRSDHSLEPVVHGIGGNGGRVNLGAYGNTPEASLSPFRAAMLILR